MGSGAAGYTPVLFQVAVRKAPLPSALPSSECGAGANCDKTVTFTLCVLPTQTTAPVTPTLPTDVKDEETEGWKPVDCLYDKRHVFLKDRHDL